MRSREWNWIDVFNKFLPKKLHLTRPDDPNFFKEINKRPWSDPVPAVALIYASLVLTTMAAGLAIVTAGLLLRSKKS